MKYEQKKSELFYFMAESIDFFIQTVTFDIKSESEIHFSRQPLVFEL